MTSTIKQVVEQLKDLCANHTQVNSYYHATKSIVDEYKSFIIEHTTVISQVKTASFNPTDITVTFEIICVDKVLDGRENCLEIESNTLQVLGDITNIIGGNADIWQYARYTGTPTATKLIERTLDKVDGWSATIQIRLIKDNGTCEIPTI